jgi:hypothetical protein
MFPIFLFGQNTRFLNSGNNTDWALSNWCAEENVWQLTGKHKKQHNEELHNLQSSPNIIYLDVKITDDDTGKALRHARKGTEMHIQFSFYWIEVSTNWGPLKFSFLGFCILLHVLYQGDQKSRLSQQLF